MKKTQGVSLITLVITIVVIIILAGISIYNGILKNVTETENTMDYNEIFEVSEAVNQRALLHRLNANSYQLIGTTGDFSVDIITYSGDTEIKKTELYSSSNGWYQITENDSPYLNLEKVRKTYLINYNTGEVVSPEAITYENKKYFTASSLRNAMAGNEVVTANQYDDVKGVNRPYVVNGMLPVKMVSGSWVVTTVDDPDWYDYAASASGNGNAWANIMLLDEVELEGVSNAQIRNASAEALDGKVVTKEGSMFVWIPRYSRGEIDGEMRIVYSKLTEDFFPDETEDNVLDAFEENGIKFTGIWVSKYDASYFEK